MVGEYNRIMEAIGLDQNTIGTPSSLFTEGWTLRDMVAECEYTLNMYYKNESAFADMDRETWRSETEMLRVFIRKHRAAALQMETKVSHLSIYDSHYNKF